MRGQVAGRELDDVGDAVLSYAETKALATGNSLVIEQAGIRAELAKLERLARARHDEQRRLARTAATTRVDAGRRRADATRYDAALTRRIDTSGDRFTMDIDGHRHTKRVEAGRHLTRHVRHVLSTLAGAPGTRHELPARTIGHLGGFPLRLDGYRLGMTTEARLTLALDDASCPPPGCTIGSFDWWEDVAPLKKTTRSLSSHSSSTSASRRCVSASSTLD